MSKTRYFSELLSELAVRAARSTISRLGFSNPALRKHLSDIFSRDYGQAGAFLGDPVFEATFGWETADQTMDSLAGNLLPETLVAAMDNPPGGKRSEYRFPRQINPYSHQLQAWKVLLGEKPQSTVVTSGTGSGKTECFMVPILSQLANEIEASPSTLVGVRALFLYPLNALIQSQRDRLHAWTAPFDGKVRFCLYNGLTLEKEPKHKRDATPNQVIDRDVLRASPAPILVTNATMLEYMLVRAQDAPIIEASEGKLQWIVLDEAHTYIGSQAAELALLLRRVLHAFKVKPEQVRFVATSATIGGPKGEAGEKLREFLANLAGVESTQVHVISGQRRIPGLGAGDQVYKHASLDELVALDRENTDIYEALSSNDKACEIRNLFVPSAEGTPANSLATIVKAIDGTNVTDSIANHRTALEWLDLLTSASAVKENGSAPFLPLRLHAFHNVLSGLWACCDPQCAHTRGTPLESDEWPYGKVFTDERRHCDCGAPVYELRSCNDCNSTYLWGRMVSRDGQYRLIQSKEETGDEFALDIEIAEDDLDDRDIVQRDDPVLIANGYTTGTGEVTVDRSTMELDPQDQSNVVHLRVKNETSTNSGQVALVCPECGGHHGHGRYMFRKAILGAPFLLSEIIPTMLEFCPDGEKPLALPLRGRRMITFTDSRQGTARLAAKLQQDSERSRVRGLVYQRAVTSGNGANSVDADRLANEINTLRRVGSAELNVLIEAKEVELANLNRPVAQPFAEMASWLSTNEADIRDWMHEYYTEMDPREFSGAGGGERLAKILIMREFARRPKRLNSLETMGLVSVQYPKLDKLDKVPNVSGLDIAITAQEWKEFLKICLDFHVRENTFINLPEAYRKWGGNRLGAKLLLPPQSTEEQANRIKRWPQCNRQGQQSRLVRLLAYVYNLDPTSEKGRDTIDALLRQAWEHLVQCGLLQPAENGRLLDINDLAFAPIEKAWICPVTRRVLDVALRGVTPYLPVKALSPKVTQCSEITMPVCDLLAKDYVNAEERIAVIRNWVNNNALIQEYRNEGVWSDLSDRIVEGGSYFRTAEHSAQQSGARLSDYEDKFKSGRINLLSCSTTMEMGVDIGGISIVAMNNVPPHPANYLQRAGRAGRRSETRSVALTLCKNNPHDQYVFANTLWPFQTELPAPSISLSSPVIVQRHINSLLLSSFLKSTTNPQGGLHKLNMEWWMLPKGDSPADHFIAWAQCFDEKKELEVTSGMRSLVKKTCYEGVASLGSLTNATAKALRERSQKWYAEYDAIDTQMVVFQGPKKESEAVYRALSVQLSRLTGEYLLRELAAGGFLPGYGFPTDITSFDTLTRDEIERSKARKKSGREDNVLRHRDLPSRDIVTALREYAPGAEVVIDGLVYRSEGITLNWHAPASVQEIKEIQNIREAWRCASCGASGTSIGAVSIGHCPECGETLSVLSSDMFSYLEPAGFSVDLYTSPHNDVSTQAFIPVEAPWINIDGEWVPLSNPKLGRFRLSTTGSVFHYSSGEAGLGYAICLECGRAAPMGVGSEDPDEVVMPEIFRRPHRRLRGAQGGDTAICEGSNKPFGIKPGLRLGHEMVTDVFELMLRSQSGQWIENRRVAYSLAVAIRRSVTALLGVEESELGCDTKPVRTEAGGIAQVIVVFDRNASGYCSTIGDHVQTVLRNARTALECIADCEDVCQHCLLNYDTRFRMDDLNRYSALEFLTPQWLDAIALQEEYALFGADRSFAESRALPEAVTREWSKPGSNELRIYLSGEPVDWDIAASPLRNWVQRWAADERDVKLVVPIGTKEHIAKADRFILQILSSLNGVSVWIGEPPVARSSAEVAVEIVADKGSLGWAQREAGIALPGIGWGGGEGNLLVRGVNDAIGTIEQQWVIEDTAPAEMSDRPYRIEILGQLDGMANGFGNRLLQYLEEHAGGALLSGQGEVVRVKYHDRYLNSPLPTALLIEFISAMKVAYQDRWNVQEIELITVPLPGNTMQRRAASKVFDNWPNQTDRDAVLRECFDYIGLTTKLEILQKRNAMHARLLEFECEDGHWTRIWLDQGFAYWHVPRRALHGSKVFGVSFPFNAEKESQAERVSEPRFTVESQAFSTFVFVDKA